MHHYYIEDGQVLRYDNNLAERPRELRGALRPEESISIEGIKRMIDEYKNEIENDKLEQQMGCISWQNYWNLLSRVSRTSY